MLDIGYRLQTFTIELQSAAFAFLLADQQKTQKIINQILGKREKKCFVLFSFLFRMYVFYRGSLADCSKW